MWAAEIESYSSPGSSYRNSHELTVLATAGYLLIMSVFVVVYVIDSTQHMFEVLFLFCGAILNIAAAIFQIIIGIKYEGNFGSFLIAACLCGNAVLMVLDFIREMK